MNRMIGFVGIRHEDGRKVGLGMGRDNIWVALFFSVLGIVLIWSFSVFLVSWVSFPFSSLLRRRVFSTSFFTERARERERERAAFLLARLMHHPPPFDTPVRHYSPPSH